MTTRVVLLTTVLVVVGPGTLRVEVFVTVIGRSTVRVVLLTTVFVLVLVFLMISFSISVTVRVNVLYLVTMLVCVTVAVWVIVRIPKARPSRGLATTDDARVPNTRPLAKREPFIVARA